MALAEGLSNLSKQADANNDPNDGKELVAEVTHAETVTATETTLESFSDLDEKKILRKVRTLIPSMKIIR